LYKSPFEFKGKESERALQRKKPGSDTEDSGDEDGPARKRVRVTKKNAKVVVKRWEEPPGLTYGWVKQELEEEPMPTGIGKMYFNKKDFFRLIFEPDDQEWVGQGWKDKPYLHALKTMKDHLEKEDMGFVMKRLRFLFDSACHCVPNISRDRWLANSAGSKFKPAWIPFDAKGNRIDCSSHRESSARGEGSSWRESRSIHWDKYWDITVEEAISEE